MAHDFKNYPELTNAQMDIYYFESPHKQLTEDFEATVTRVKDGDTIEVKTDLRNFVFPIRLANTAAPEMSEAGGQISKSWLEDKLQNQEVTILVDRNNRIEKWGRLLGEVILMGININNQLVAENLATTWENIDRNRLNIFETEIKKQEKLWR